MAFLLGGHLLLRRLRLASSRTLSALSERRRPNRFGCCSRVKGLKKGFLEPRDSGGGRTSRVRESKRRVPRKDSSQVFCYSYVYVVSKF